MSHHLYVGADYPAPTTAEGALGEIASRIRGLTNILRSANDSQEFTRDRLLGQSPETGTEGLRCVPSQLPGAIGEVIAALDELDNQCSRASSLVGPFARL